MCLGHNKKELNIKSLSAIYIHIYILIKICVNNYIYALNTQSYEKLFGRVLDVFYWHGYIRYSSKAI